MPINRRVPLVEFGEAIQFYLQKTRRRVTIQYVLLSGVNDDAAALVARVVRRRQGRREGPRDCGHDVRARGHLCLPVASSYANQAEANPTQSNDGNAKKSKWC